MNDRHRRTAVVVVNYGSAALIRENLAPLTRSAPDLQVVVVDNFSSAAALAEVTELTVAERWTLVALDVNRGFGAGMNAGIAAARSDGADTFLLLNPDATISVRDLDVLTTRLDEAPFALLAPTIVRPDGSIWFRGGALGLDRGRTMSRPVDPDSARELPWLSGACLMTSSEVWDAVGGFDDDYFLYWEDVDLSVRAARAGVRLEVVETAEAVHDEGGTQERHDRDFSWDYYYFNIRNRLLFAGKLLEPSDRRRWQLCSVRESYRILLRGGGRRKFIRPWKPLRCGYRGIRDGIRLGRRSPGRSGPGQGATVDRHA